MFQFNQYLLNNIYIVIIINVAQFIKQMITGFDSNISDKCNIQIYCLELRRKLKAYTMSRFYLQFGLQSRCDRCLDFFPAQCVSLLIYETLNSCLNLVTYNRALLNVFFYMCEIQIYVTMQNKAFKAFGYNGFLICKQVQTSHSTRIRPSSLETS